MGVQFAENRQGGNTQPLETQSDALVRRGGIEKFRTQLPGALRIQLRVSLHVETSSQPEEMGLVIAIRVRTAEFDERR